MPKHNVPTERALLPVPAVEHPGGTGNRRFRIYILWPDGATYRVCGPVEEQCCCCDCELKAVITSCLRIIPRKQQEEAALPVVIFTDYRAFVQALGRSGREDVGEAAMLADRLQKTEGVRNVVQWLPSHAGVVGVEIADGLANEGRTQPQKKPRKPSTLSDAVI
ncbi:hypothetical protein PoB_003897900 [Plakobranchus ocellatus]|uniref:RNase H type-1 domain-containing protein n=1 Tax=Plakobranchus ocellatus TaxID=259542 RepID=A0AAV4B1A9_9GAST|nr:hypothetical protein PoB_003897900 [Plakobranchus ocellatus]